VTVVAHSWAPSGEPPPTDNQAAEPDRKIRLTSAVQAAAVAKSSDCDLTGSPGVSGWTGMCTPDLLDGHANVAVAPICAQHGR
jgi:hypothetical protein